MNDVPTITVLDSEDAATVVGAGELDLHNGDKFRAALKQADASGKNVVVDLRNANYIDTAILALLVMGSKDAMVHEKTLRVLIAQGSHPQYVLKTVGFADIMEIVVADKEAAI